MNYKNILSGVLAAAIFAACTGYQNTDSIICIMADDITESSQTDTTQTPYEFTRNFYDYLAANPAEPLHYSDSKPIYFFGEIFR